MTDNNQYGLHLAIAAYLVDGSPGALTSALRAVVMSGVEILPIMGRIVTLSANLATLYQKVKGEEDEPD
jgi:hypothetical protein